MMSSPRASSSPWPKRPYKGFGTYGPADVPLLAGRGTQIAEFADMVAEPKVRLLLLHGTSGCGKSSFLRAGVIPLLEGSLASFTFLKNPSAPTLAPGAPDRAAFFIRSTADPLTQLAAEVFRVADQGFDVRTPSGLRHLSLEAAKLECRTTADFILKITERPRDLVMALKRLAEALPVKFVLVVDQAEEVVTLNRRSDKRSATRFFTFLAAAAGVDWPLNLIVSMRTEFFGLVRARLRRHSPSRRPLPVHDYFLEDMGPEDVLEAILQPTLEDSPYGAPRDVYHFSFETGLPERIVAHLTKAADDSGLVGGMLPFVQVVCESLYTETKDRAGSAKDWVITPADYQQRAPLEWLAGYVDTILRKTVRADEGEDVALVRWKDTLAKLVKVQADGAVTTDTIPVKELHAFADTKKAADFDRVVRDLVSDELALLRCDRQQHPRGPVDTCSLRHDAIGLVLNEWTNRNVSQSLDLVSTTEIEKLMPSVETIEFACTFDEQGSGEQVRRWLNITARQVFVDFCIPYAFAVSPQGRVIVDTESLVVPTQDPRSALPIRFLQREASATDVVGNIQIKGDLTPDTGFVGFELRQRFERAFYTSRNEVDRAYANDTWKTEWMGTIVQLPTSRLVLKVRFPASFAVPEFLPGPVVFFGSGEKQHEGETERVRSGFKLADGVATLEISKPQQGLQYAIYWMPPA